MKDQLKRELHFDYRPRRIVSLVPSLTELLVDLGLEDDIVGVTKFCVHPEHLRKSVVVVGGTKTVKRDKIEELTPDFILANKEENEEEIVNSLSESFPVYVSDINTIDDLLLLIEDLSRIFDIADKGAQLKGEIKSRLHSFRKQISAFPKLKVAYFIWKEPWMVAGSHTFIDYMLRLNNFDNVYGTLERYPEINIDTLETLDYVLLSSEPFPFKEEHKKELPVERSKIVIIDGEYFSWYGSRLLKAFEYFINLRDKL